MSVCLVSGCEGSLEKKLRNDMRDPQSTQFKDKVTHENFACIEVNSKNSYGGYTGFKTYTMKSGYGDSWEILSEKEYCSKDTLVARAKQEKAMDAADAITEKAAEAEVLALMKEKKLIPAAVKDEYDIKDEKCKSAASNAMTAARISHSLRHIALQDKYQEQLEKRMHEFRQGTCDVPPGLKNY
jgi:hypothetical protein